MASKSASAGRGVSGVFIGSNVSRGGTSLGSPQPLRRLADDQARAHPLEMNQARSKYGISDGEKYALLGISIKLPREGLGGIVISPRFSVIGWG